jgi:glycosyltransferase involved in cell wall biosynthesis
MRVLQIVHQFPPEHIGGVELITQQLHDNLGALGHQCLVLTRGSTPQNERQNGIYVAKIDASPAKRFLATYGQPMLHAEVSQLLAREAFDIVHLQHLMGYPASIVDTIVARRIPLVISIHDYWHACANAQLITNFDHAICDGPGLLKCSRCAAARGGWPGLSAPAFMPLMALRSRLLKRTLAQAAVVTSPSSFVIEWFRTQGWDTTHWRVIPYGLNGTPRTPYPPAPTPRIAYVGSLAWQKGVHVLIDAFNRMPPDAQLTIAGPLDVFPEYVAELRKQAVHPGIRFSGVFDRAQVWTLLSESDALVMSSLWHETASLTAREGLAAGCHVIASHVGALSEAITDASQGTLVPPGDVDALAEALQRVPRGARQQRPFRTAAEYAHDMLAVYQEAIAAT